MERGKVSLDTLFERAVTWCLASLPVEPGRLGSERRTVHAVDSSTVARWRERKGRATVQLADGTVCEAEIHWFEAHGIGRKDFKIKRVLR